MDANEHELRERPSGVEGLANGSLFGERFSREIQASASFVSIRVHSWLN
jgi:hypothetical protein